MTFSRRAFLTALGASGLVAGCARTLAAIEPGADWRLGFQNAPAEGFAEAPLTLIEGRPPGDFAGTLYRNGPGWFRYGDDITGHWFDGDGMIQKIALSPDGARHEGRFVDTPKRRIEQARQAIVMPGFGTKGRDDAPVMAPDDVNAANTALLKVDGDLWALWEAGSPWRVDADTLASGGPVALSDDLRSMPFTAHPKVEPDGTVWAFGSFGKRAVVYKLDAKGALLTAFPVDLPMPGYAHDWAVSARHLILPLQPWVAETSVPPFVDSLTWRPEQGMKILVIAKDDPADRRVFELPARAFFHTGDAWEEADGTIRFDVCLTPDPTFGAQGAKDLVRGVLPPNGPKPKLAFVALHPDGRARLEETTIGAEFPQVDQRFQGLRRDRVYAVAERGDEDARFGSDGWFAHDWRTGKTDLIRIGEEYITEEPLFVPRGTGQDDGWLIAPALNLQAPASEVWLFDAGALSAGPLAVWRAPRAWPLGFHGTFMQA